MLNSWIAVIGVLLYLQLSHCVDAVGLNIFGKLRNINPSKSSKAESLGSLTTRIQRSFQNTPAKTEDGLSSDPDYKLYTTELNYIKSIKLPTMGDFLGEKSFLQRLPFLSRFHSQPTLFPYTRLFLEYYCRELNHAIEILDAFYHLRPYSREERKLLPFYHRLNINPLKPGTGGWLHLPKRRLDFGEDDEIEPRKKNKDTSLAGVLRRSDVSAATTIKNWVRGRSNSQANAHAVMIERYQRKFTSSRPGYDYKGKEEFDYFLQMSKVVTAHKEVLSNKKNDERLPGLIYPTEPDVSQDRLKNQKFMKHYFPEDINLGYGHLGNVALNSLVQDFKYMARRTYPKSPQAFVSAGKSLLNLYFNRILPIGRYRGSFPSRLACLLAERANRMLDFPRAFIGYVNTVPEGANGLRVRFDRIVDVHSANNLVMLTTASFIYFKVLPAVLPSSGDGALWRLRNGYESRYYDPIVDQF